jgi:hypothetical protein
VKIVEIGDPVFPAASVRVAVYVLDQSVREVIGVKV